MTHVGRVLVDFDLRQPTDVQKKMDFDGVERDQAGMTVHAQRRTPRSAKGTKQGSLVFECVDAIENRVSSLACSHERRLARRQSSLCRHGGPKVWDRQDLVTDGPGGILCTDGLKSDFIVPRAHKTWLRVAFLSGRLFFSSSQLLLT